MALRAKIHECLLADTRVTALIGSGVDCRHYPERAPIGVLAPYVVDHHISSVANTTHGQPGDTEDTMDETLIQHNCFGETVESADALRLALRQALLEDTNGILAAAHIVVTDPTQRNDPDEEVAKMYAAQLDLTYFHNPNT